MYYQDLDGQYEVVTNPNFLEDKPSNVVECNMYETCKIFKNEYIEKRALEQYPLEAKVLLAWLGPTNNLCSWAAHRLARAPHLDECVELVTDVASYLGMTPRSENNRSMCSIEYLYSRWTCSSDHECMPDFSSIIRKFFD